MPDIKNLRLANKEIFANGLWQPMLPATLRPGSTPQQFMMKRFGQKLVMRRALCCSQ
jgi:hypothetical protein